MSEPEGRPSKGRRRFLGVVGASGLATAAAVFGRSSPALAANWACCQLVFPSGNNRVSYSTCVAYSNKYNWLCWYPNTQRQRYCMCCEGKNSAGSTVVSGAACWNR